MIHISFSEKFLKTTFGFILILSTLTIYFLIQVGILSLYRSAYGHFGKIGCLMSLTAIILVLSILIYKMNSRYQLLDLSVYRNIKYYKQLIILYLCATITGTIVTFLQSILTSYSTMTSNQQNWNSLFKGETANVFAVFTLAIFIAPFFEEFICRHIVFSTGEKIKSPFLILLAISASLFSMLHTPLNIFDFSKYFIIGTALCFMYKKYNYAGSVGLHVFNNTVAIITMSLSILK